MGNPAGVVTPARMPAAAGLEIAGSTGVGGAEGVDAYLQLSSDSQSHRLFVYLQDREGRHHPRIRAAGRRCRRVLRPPGLPKCFLKLEGYGRDRGEPGSGGCT